MKNELNMEIINDINNLFRNIFTKSNSFKEAEKTSDIEVI